MKNYYNEIDNLIQNLEVNKKERILKNNDDTLKCYWQIGKYLYENYVMENESDNEDENSFINIIAEGLNKKYGESYSLGHFRKFRAFYKLFPEEKLIPYDLSWEHIMYLLPLKNKQEINYYLKLCQTENYTARELREKLIHNIYKKLPPKEKNILINIIRPKALVISATQKKVNNLKVEIMAHIQNYFTSLNGFYYIKQEYNDCDLLLFNNELNCFIAVNLCMKKITSQDKLELIKIKDAINIKYKKSYHNNTMGIIISLEEDNYIVSYICGDNIVPLSFIKA